MRACVTAGTAAHRVLQRRSRERAAQGPDAFNRLDPLHLERFYQVGQTQNDVVMLPDGQIKTSTRRGIEDPPPYLHDGRLPTLANTVEFFNLVLGLKLTPADKDALVAYLLAL